MTGAVDYWSNAFTVDRAPMWREVIERDGLSIRLGARDGDDFCAAADMVERMDALGIDTLVLPVIEMRGDEPIEEFHRYAVRPTELRLLASSHPGRFAGLWSIDPDAGDADLDATADALDRAHYVGVHLHTHSWGRPLDHPDYSPYHNLCAEYRVPFVAQAGQSGGHRDHGLGHPNGIGGPATIHPAVTFVLSHTGFPWVSETIDAARRHPNVVIGTATHPPRRWPEELVEFIRTDGADSVLWGTGYPLTGHGHSLGQLDALELDDDGRTALLGGNARRIFTRLPERSRT
ncbi:MAG: amidohydrolase family protein [Actinomycetota bacterium]